MLRLITQSRRRTEIYGAEIERKVAEGKKIWGDEFTVERIAIGDTMIPMGDGIAQKAGEYIRGLIQLESDERDRLAVFSSKAIAAGLAERQIRLTERHGQMLAMTMGAIMDDLGLTKEQRVALPDVIRREVARMRSGDALERVVDVNTL
ncbi:hypothetical protein ACFOYW_16390 [Gryllotalpicola reticulitermitis]|uniref:Uncharacterized protein n=1 Tax=Gryllotalpicola reticulitermitis TaxID=1184153 RepID=A0ABV8QBR2_9MICO